MMTLLVVRPRMLLPVALLCSWQLPAVAQEAKTVTSNKSLLSHTTVAVESTNRDSPLERRVTLNLRRVSLATALTEIDKQAKLGLSYSPLYVPLKRIVDIQLNNVTAEQALKHVLAGTDVKIVPVIKGRIALTSDKKISEPRSADSLSGSIQGHIIDGTTEVPIGGATIQVIGTNLKYITQSDGRFTIAGVPSGTHTIRVTRLGFSVTESTVIVREGKQSTVDIRLSAAAIKLNDVVTTATGVQRRMEIGNSIATINAEEVVANAPITNLSSLLAARAPGVQVLTSAGTLGAGSRIRIRGITSAVGSGDPILIVDGIRMNAAYSDGGGQTNLASPSSRGPVSTATARLDDIDINTIETIEVLKGPSAATLYGSDAANGVIVITTKRSRSGSARWSVFGQAGTSKMRATFPEVWRGWGKSLVTGPGVPVVCDLLALSNGSCIKMDSMTHYNPLNQKETTPFGRGNDYTYGGQVSGGSDQLQYFFSGSLLDNVGLLKMPDVFVDRLKVQRNGAQLPDWQRRPNTLQKLSASSRIFATLGSIADVSLSTAVIRQEQRSSSDAAVIGYATNGVGYRDTVYEGWNNNATPDIFFASKVTNNIMRGYSALNATVRPMSWLNGRGTLGVDYTDRTDGDFTRAGDIPTPSAATDGNSNRAESNTVLYSGNFGATAMASLAPQVLSRTSIGLQFARSNTKSLVARGTGLSLGATSFNGAQTKTVEEAFNENATAGWYIEQTGIIRDNLFVTAALRQDAGSAFGRRVKAPTFPKLSMSWLVSQESFFPQFEALHNFRLRFAYGHSGVQPSTTAALRTFQSGEGYVDGVRVNAAYLLSLGNVALLPERVREFEGGFDISLLNDRVTIEQTTYRKISKNALVSRSLPNSLGGNGTKAGNSPLVSSLAGRQENIGSVLNTGTEWSITAMPIQTMPFTLNVMLGTSANRNKLLTLGENVPPTQTTNNRNVPGYPLSGRWNYPILGFFDSNEDGVITANELIIGDSMQFAGSPIPSRQTTFSTTFGFLNNRIRISGLFDYRGGGLATDGITRMLCPNRCQSGVDPSTPLDQQAGSIAVTVSPPISWAYASSQSFTRFREASLSYDIPESILRRLRTRSATVLLMAQNLALWTKYSGADPSVNASPAGNNVATDGALPLPRNWMLRVNLGF